MFKERPTSHSTKEKLTTEESWQANEKHNKPSRYAAGAVELCHLNVCFLFPIQSYYSVETR